MMLADIIQHETLMLAVDIVVEISIRFGVNSRTHKSTFDQIESLSIELSSTIDFYLHLIMDQLYLKSIH